MKNGVVVDKWYEEGTSKTYSYYDVSLKMSMVRTIWDDEDYVLIVKGFNGKHTVKQRFEVSQKDFKNIKVGDSVAFQ